MSQDILLRPNPKARPLAQIAGGAVLAAAALAALTGCVVRKTDSPQIERGRYLVKLMQCGDCHTPGALSPTPDMKRQLAGSDVQFEVAGEGVFVPPNLTPDPSTGIGKWTKAQIVRAITTGVTPEGRVLSSAMPWADFKALTPSDAMAVAAYLKSLPPVVNKIPPPSPAKPMPKNVVESITQRAPVAP